jgi:methylated-DNA-protein-cysteine methyltransferase related protein
MTEFFEMIYEVVRQVPQGRVTSYGAIAKYLGTARSSRMVGWAMNNAHQLKQPVPAHRVVNRNGQLTGKMHFATPTQMQELLQAEGIEVEDDKIVNFKKHFWNPEEELKL